MCPICNQSKYKEIGIPKTEDKVSKILRTEYRVVKCVDCGFYYIYPSIDFSQSEWQMLYSKDYFPQLTSWHYLSRKRNRISRINSLERFSKNKISKFLDLGCGTGEMLVESNAMGWETFGVDITDHRISAAKDSSIKFFSGTVFESNYPDNFFDCIYMDSVLEHVSDPIKYLNELNRILKKDGIAYIGVPNEDSLFNSIKKTLYILAGKKHNSSRLQPFVTPYHIGGFTYKSLKLASWKTNFEILKLRNFASKLDFLSFKIFSKQFIQSLLISFTYLIAVPLKKEVYFEIYLRKK